MLPAYVRFLGSATQPTGPAPALPLRSATRNVGGIQHLREGGRADAQLGFDAGDRPAPALVTIDQVGALGGEPQVPDPTVPARDRRTAAFLTARGRAVPVRRRRSQRGRARRLGCVRAREQLARPRDLLAAAQPLPACRDSAGTGPRRARGDAPTQAGRTAAVTGSARTPPGTPPVTTRAGEGARPRSSAGYARTGGTPPGRHRRPGHRGTRSRRTVIELPDRPASPRHLDRLAAHNPILPAAHGCRSPASASGAKTRRPDPACSSPPKPIP